MDADAPTPFAPVTSSASGERKRRRPPSLAEQQSRTARIMRVNAAIKQRRRELGLEP